MSRSSVNGISSKPYTIRTHNIRTMVPTGLLPEPLRRPQSVLELARGSVTSTVQNAERIGRVCYSSLLSDRRNVLLPYRMTKSSASTFHPVSSERASYRLARRMA
jgi:hypothetical protein